MAVPVAAAIACLHLRAQGYRIGLLFLGSKFYLRSWRRLLMSIDYRGAATYRVDHRKKYLIGSIGTRRKSF